MSAEMAFNAYVALILARKKAQINGTKEPIIIGEYSIGTIDADGHINIKMENKDSD